MRTPFLVIASHRRWRGNPVNYARAYARLYYDWIATVAMLPRDDKKHHTQFPSVGGVPRSGGVVRECKKVPHLCHCERNVAISFLLLCRSGAYAPCAYPRICSNCAIACFHILFIPSAYACGYPRICSNCASACFHILGFIASHRRWRGNPVNKTCRAATQYLNFAL